MKKMTRRFLSLLLALMLVLSLGVTALAVDEGDLPEEALCTEAHPEEDMQIPADEDVPGAGEDAQLPEEAGSAEAQSSITPCAHRYYVEKTEYVSYTYKDYLYCTARVKKTRRCSLCRHQDFEYGSELMRHQMSGNYCVNCQHYF